jgi:glycosyltransferase involved in cell wall biosynthesis/RimJ/RimL family protein N-acetyltransferase
MNQKMNNNFPVLFTERLKLVEINQKHSEDFFQIFSNSRVTQFYTMPTLTEVSEASKYIVWLEDKYEQKKGISWGITIKNEEKIIGVVGFNNFQLNHRGNVFGVLKHEFWNRGIMTESLSEVIKFGYNKLKINRVDAETLLGNKRMQNVFLKLGFRIEGVLRDWLYWNNQYFDMTMFSLLKSEFLVSPIKGNSNHIEISNSGQNKIQSENKLISMKNNSKIIFIQEPDFPQWDAFVDKSPQGDVFCYSWWLDTITKGNFKILAVFENDEIVAGMPLAYYLGKINEPPLTRTLGPLFTDLSELPHGKEITKKRQWLEIMLEEIPLDEFEQFSTSHNFTDWLPFRWRGLKQSTRYTHIITYEDKTEKEIWHGLNKGHKAAVQKARRLKLKARVVDDFDLLYDLVEKTYIRQGLTFRFSRDDFRNLDEKVKNHGNRIIIAVFDHDNVPHAAAYISFNPKSAFLLLTGSDTQFRHMGSHTQVVWEAIAHFREKVEYFNFGGSDIQRIEAHIKGFGGELRQYFHIYKEHPQIKKVERVIEKKVVKEVPMTPPPPPDNWRYHIGVVRRHSWILIKKALYKMHIRFNLPVRVSVIVPCYNHGRFIHEMLQSVLNQTYPFYEIIIVNDGSTDDTAEILNRIKHKKVRVFHTPNHGPAHARNFAATQARGDLIVNLDADDKMAPAFLQKCVEIMDKYPNAGIVYSDVEFFGNKTGSFDIPEYSFETMLRGNCIVANACFRKGDWEQTEGYSSFLQNGYEDFDFWLSILELGRDVQKIHETLIFYRTYEYAESSRSGRRKKEPDKVQEVVVQAFRRHRELYKKVPAVYKEFLQLESAFATSRKEHPAINPTPVFSIVTPTSRRPEFLVRNIQSLQKQSFTDWEQIIVDDANDPETRQLVEALGEPRIRYIAHPKPKGAAGAYNTGMKNAAGKYINFLDDDDEYLPGILEKQKRTFDKFGHGIGFIWTGITRVKDTDAGEDVIKTQVWPEEFKTRELGLTVSTAIGNGFGLSMKSSCLKKTGFYNETNKVGQDTDFMMRLSKYYNFRTVPEVLVKIHHGHNQLTHDKYIRIRWESYGRIIKRNYAFLSKHWDTIYIHNHVYVNLCYEVGEKAAGIKALWRLIRTFPGRRITWLDLASYLFEGKDYNSGKIKHRLQNYRQSKHQKKEETERNRTI